MTHEWNYRDIDPQELFKGLILECPFTRLEEVFYYKVPYFAAILSFIGFFETLNFPNIDRIGRITVPIQFIHGDHDGLVPYAHS